MTALIKREVSKGIFWIEAVGADLRLLCGCPADAVKHLMKRGYIAPVNKAGVAFETGPNAILLSDVMIQNGTFSNVGEFPVLQMLYRQGMILPNHPGNTGTKPLLIGSGEQVQAQLRYIHRGNYGLLSEDELIEAGASVEQAKELMRLKLKFAFGKIRHPSELIDTLSIEDGSVEIRAGVSVRRLRLNVFEISYKGETALVDLNLLEGETYDSPYPLGFYNLPREHFAIVHSGEGDGWDINRPSMGSILVYQGRIHLIDAGPNILYSLDALGIGVNEIDGLFHTHSHDDHFAGLTALIRADHRIKYYATPLVRATVSKKLSALLGIEETSFQDYFDVHDLSEGVWNDIDGLEVKPIHSPHPVETTVMYFRALGEHGYKSYAHLADIIRLQVLKGFITANVDQPGLSALAYDRVAADYLVPADVKKVDVGGGLIHGDAYDFRADTSEKIILAHTAQRHSLAMKAIGSAASFGTMDILIPTHRDLIRAKAEDALHRLFPEANSAHLGMLKNNPIVTFNPGTILLKERQSTSDIFLLLTGSVECIPVERGARTILSAGAMLGEMAGLFDMPVGETYRALGFVQAMRIPTRLYGEFVRRSDLFASIQRLLEAREFLSRTWLFGEVVSTETLNAIARDMKPVHLMTGESPLTGGSAIGLLQQGRLGRFLGDKLIDEVAPGDFFGEEEAVFGTPSLFHLRALEGSDAFLIPATLVAETPSVRWKLFEVNDKRLRTLAEGRHGADLLAWHEEYRVDIQTVDTQHRRLFELANVLLNEARPERDPAGVRRALEDFRAYGRWHFTEEEGLLRHQHYPELASHQRLHEGLIARLDDLERHFGNDNAIDQSWVLSFLKDWLVGHILAEDRRYAPFLNSKGVY